MIKKKDFVRLYIISKKINQKSIISEAGFEDLRVIYNCYLVVYYMQEALFRMASECHQVIFDCLSKDAVLQDKMAVSEELTQFSIRPTLQTSFENFVSLLLISDYTPEKRQAIDALKAGYQRVLLTYPALDKVVRAMTGNEIVMPQFEQYQLEEVEVFRQGEHQTQRECLFRQLVQHDLRIIEKYYS